MKLASIESTKLVCLVERDGHALPARAWTAMSSGGVPMTLYVVAVEVPDAFVTREFLEEAQDDLIPIPVGEPV